MIPRIIHYCWVGNSEIPRFARDCIESWKKNCPDFEIKEWNEDNYDFTKHPYMRSAYESKIYGFVPDYARLDIIYNYGGFYFDTDVELIKSLDSLTMLSGFVGMEAAGRVNLGQGFGAEPHNKTILKMRDYYDDVEFINDYEYLDNHSSPICQTEVLKKYGLKSINAIQKVEYLTVFPTDFFCPKNIDTGEICLSSNTISIHHFDGSWTDETVRFGYHLKWKCIEKHGLIVGRMQYWIIYSFYIIKNDGASAYIKKLYRKVHKYKDYS